jgi:hypothetical protein
MGISKTPLDNLDTTCKVFGCKKLHVSRPRRTPNIVDIPLLYVLSILLNPFKESRADHKWME